MAKITHLFAIKAITVSLLVSGSLEAKVSEQEVQALGTRLTPIGAEMAGNAEGSIPAWTGGLSQAQGNYQQGYAHPFAEETPLFVIDANNYQQYKDKLSAGQIALFKTYPDTFKMPIYPSHRTSAYPQAVYDVVKANATQAELVDGGNGVTGFQQYFPFPIPKSGVELVWNHATRYRGEGAQREIMQVIPLANGEYTPVEMQEKFKFVADVQDNTLFYFMQSVTAPARLSGTVLLVQETMNQVKEPRRAWIYNAGQRRVRRAPQVAYDGPGTAADGQRTSDNLDLYNGAPDRYQWTLVGKRELYIPYNAYQLLQKDLTVADVVHPGHLNPQHTRYELHRVWEVEGQVHTGMRHIYAKRVMYFDEDTYQLALVDHYDSRGQLWRVAEGHSVYFHDVKIPWYAAETLYDLVNGRYLVTGLSVDSQGYDFGFQSDKNDYTPSALRRAGSR
ncbi:Protein of unknown function [Allopseudospirillum japonicum]|uniref:Outer membrane lipoprotein-sorting protein n=1 Tax=Allopseudospirillum japonicum TaxID=64971 RepID=A0A1H6SU77_9GAMM|nr:DUF1329 domain-containing protein [Allopseudospirillum japonicum]SEI67142.1 Protein of unknown function [Allopseudospirillum japonicum]